MITDPWTYQRDVDGSRMRQAAALVGELSPPKAVVSVEGNVVVVVMLRPLFDFLGLRKRAIANSIVDSCASVWVPNVLGWCPEMRVEWV